MNTQAAAKVIADFPAWTIVRPTAKRHLDLGIERPTFRDGDVIGLPFQTVRYGEQFRWFRFGSVVSSALRYDECPISAYQRAVEHGHKTHWLNAEATIITRESRAKEVRVGMAFGDEVIFEGRLFRIEPDHNRNAKLTEITI